MTNKNSTIIYTPHRQKKVMMALPIKTVAASMAPVFSSEKMGRNHGNKNTATSKKCTGLDCHSLHLFLCNFLNQSYSAGRQILIDFLYRMDYVAYSMPSFKIFPCFSNRKRETGKQKEHMHMQRREPGKKGVLPRGCLAWQQPINWGKKFDWEVMCFNLVTGLEFENQNFIDWLGKQEEQHEKQWQGQFFPMVLQELF